MILAGRPERIGSNASSPDTSQGPQRHELVRYFSDARLREKAAQWQAAVIDALATRVGTGERPLTQQSFYLPHSQTHFYETRRKKNTGP